MKPDNRTPVPGRGDFAKFAIGAAMVPVGLLATRQGIDIGGHATTSSGIRAGVGLIAAGLSTAGVGGVSAGRTNIGQRIGERAGQLVDKFFPDDKDLEGPPDNVIQLRPRKPKPEDEEKEE
jgi:hypothetical protein